jgi:hypothetical protein
MAELQDYSGEFRPNIKYQDFSKEALARLLAEYARLGLSLDSWWQTIVREKYGKDEAIKLELAVWDMGIPYEQRRVMKALNIQGNDVAACFKELQMDPQFCLETFDVTWDLKNNNHGIFTVNRCRAVEHFEKQGDTKTMLAMCDLDFKAFEKIARFFNPNMKVTALKLPPRKSLNEIACRFEFKLEPAM